MAPSDGATLADIALAAVTGVPATIAAWLAYKASQHASEAKREAKAGRILGQAIDNAVNSRPVGASTIGDDVSAILDRPSDYNGGGSLPKPEDPT
jgi:hypothetical protein